MKLYRPKRSPPTTDSSKKVFLAVPAALAARCGAVSLR
jgi:hypothetical protein